MTTEVIRGEKSVRNLVEAPPKATLAKGLSRAAETLAVAVEPLGRSFMVAAASITIFMALAVVFDVSWRSVVGQPFTGVLELEQLMLVVVVFSTLAYTQWNNGHVSVDLISIKYSPRVSLVINSVFLLMSIYLFVIIGWQSLMRGLLTLEEQEIALVTKIPIYPFHFIGALGFSVLLAVMVTQLLRYLSALVDGVKSPLLCLALVLLAGATVPALPALLGWCEVAVSPGSAGLAGILLLLLLMLMGFPIAFVMGLVGLVGVWYLMGAETALHVVRMAVFDSVADYLLCVIPFFVLMGFICFRAGISKTLYNATYKMFGQLPGGVAIATIFGCAGFAAICGDSLATAGTMGSVAIPEMQKYKYRDSLATGCVAAGGTLGILIPPSVGFIIYGLITEQSIGKLFAAGMIPGILLTMLFSLIIYGRCKINPSLGPAAPKMPWREKMIAVRGIWPMAILFALVIGGIYAGFFTPTEGGGVGVIGAILVGLLMRGLTWQSFLAALTESMKITAMIFAIIIGVNILGYFMVMTELPLQLSDIIVGLDVSRYVVFVLILALYLLLGMLMNIIPMMMLTLPILYPTIIALGFDPVWFGVIMVIMMEMGQITPPVGINVFVISGVARGVPMISIFRGILPFVLAEIFMIFLLTIFPIISLWIPSLMDTLP